MPLALMPGKIKRSGAAADVLPTELE